MQSAFLFVLTCILAQGFKIEDVELNPLQSHARQKRWVWSGYYQTTSRPSGGRADSGTSTGTSTICKCTSTLRAKRETEELDDDDIDFRIVGGDAAKQDEFPQICRLTYDRSMCGCSIVNNNFVLTAAHCVSGNNNLNLYTISVGLYNLEELDPNEKNVKASKIIMHPQYNSKTQENDIAVVQLKTPITWNQHTQPTCLPLTYKSYENQVVTAIGWGLTREKTATQTASIATVLRKVTVPVVPIPQCKKDYQGVSTISTSQLCAGYERGGKDSCGGDSGGPALLTTTNPPTQVGVVSFGLGCARAGYPGVYAHTGYQSKFILDNTKVDTGCQVYSNDKLQ